MYRDNRTVFEDTIVILLWTCIRCIGMLKPDIYNERHNDDKFKRLLDICIEENKMTLVVQHHKKKYSGQFPIWVIIEFFSMGMLSYLYADLKSVDQKKIARELYHTSSVCLKAGCAA